MCITLLKGRRQSGYESLRIAVYAQNTQQLWNVGEVVHLPTLKGGKVIHRCGLSRAYRPETAPDRGFPVPCR